MNINKSNSQYEVTSPWAEADPIPPRGISPRLTDLTGKKIGLLKNTKKVARPILNLVESGLKEKFPTSEVSWYESESNTPKIETEDKERFEEWVKGVDTVIAAVAD